MTANAPIRWRLTVAAVAHVRPVRDELGESGYAEDVAAFKEFMESYFRAGDCTDKTKTICPVGGAPAGGKAFKVRWGVPGSGKSGGFRMGVVAFCAEREVAVCCAEMRKEDPPDEFFEDALKKARGE